MSFFPDDSPELLTPGAGPVYDQRPEICKDFGKYEYGNLACAHLRPDGTKRSKASWARVRCDLRTFLSKIK